MAVVIKNLSNKSERKEYVFSDLNLDLIETKRSTNIRNAEVNSGNDLQIATDESAIANSIRNILLQRRFLNPSFGADLRRYIGQPLTEMGARSLGDLIDRNLNLFEPRIVVEKILVAPDYDNFQYAIVIIYKYRNFIKDSVLINGAFNISDGNLYFIK